MSVPPQGKERDMKEKKVDFLRVSKLIKRLDALSDKLIASGLPDPAGLPEYEELKLTLKKLEQTLYSDH
jgi:hypothetical protein